MNTCKTCKHWKTPEDSDSRGFGYGSEYMAVLATAEDFGCVRHEK